MTNQSIRWSVAIGIIAILSVLGMQTYWLIEALKIENSEFNQSVQIALLNTAKRIAATSEASDMPIENPVKQIYSDYFVVNTNSYLEAEVLEVYLISEFEKVGLHYDFEYGIYDCHTDQMAYGAFVDADGKSNDTSEYAPLPKEESMVYYFGVRFPNKKRILITDLSVWLAFMAFSILVMLFFGYAIVMLMRQKRFSEQQKDFINNMTHEFKTPMSSIKLAADFLQQQDAIQSNERYKRYIDIIISQNTRLTSQVENVLQISRAEKGSFELQNNKLDLKQLLNAIVSETMANNKTARITFSTALADIAVTGDEMHISNVMYSIVDNAIKYSPEHISIDISAEKQDNKYIISIADKGIGIADQHLKKVFHKFYRVPTGNIHNVKGFGLGLYYANIICKKHSWNLSLKSSEGKGTTVLFKIPINS